MTNPTRSTSPVSPPTQSDDAAPSDKQKAKAESGDVGTALRNAFRATLEEDIPAEMLDLLKRLD